MRFSFIDWKDKGITNNPCFRTRMSMKEREYLEKKMNGQKVSFVEYSNIAYQSDLNRALRKINMEEEWKK